MINIQIVREIAEVIPEGQPRTPRSEMRSERNILF